MSRKPYVRPLSKTTWWMGHRRTQWYMAREISCVFIGLYSLGWVFGLICLAIGPVAWGSFVGLMTAPPLVAFHLVAFVFATIHAVSWFTLAPKAMTLRLPNRDDPLPAETVYRGHLIAWGVVSLIILLVVGVV